MDFFEVVEKRNSYRGEFVPCDMPEEHIKKIVNAGIAAPTGMRIRTTSYIVIQSKEVIEALCEILPNYKMQNAGFVLAVITENIENHLNMHVEIENYAAAVENILLASVAMGYATVWTDGMLKFPEIKEQITALLNVPPHKSVRAVLPIGIPKDKIKIHPKESFEEMVHFNIHP